MPLRSSSLSDACAAAVFSSLARSRSRFAAPSLLPSTLALASRVSSRQRASEVLAREEKQGGGGESDVTLLPPLLPPKKKDDGVRSTHSLFYLCLVRPRLHRLRQEVADLLHTNLHWLPCRRGGRRRGGGGGGAEDAARRREDLRPHRRQRARREMPSKSTLLLPHPPLLCVCLEGARETRERASFSLALPLSHGGARRGADTRGPRAATRKRKKIEEWGRIGDARMTRPTITFCERFLVSLPRVASPADTSSSRHARNAATFRGEARGGNIGSSWSGLDCRSEFFLLARSPLSIDGLLNLDLLISPSPLQKPSSATIGPPPP